MVRQSRHHGMVEQSLAQRGLRHLDGSESDRALPSAVADLAQRQRAQAIRHEPGCARHVASDPATGRRRDRGVGDVRRHHLLQGGRHRAHARGLRRGRRLSRGAAPIHGRARLRQHHDGRPVAGDRGRVRQAGRRRGRGLHRAARGSARRRRGQLRRRRATHRVAAGAVHHRRPRCGSAALAGAGRGRAAARARGRRKPRCCRTSRRRSRPGDAASR